MPHPSSTRSRRGAIAVLTALTIVFLAGLLAFSIDVGMICHRRNVAQNNVDAAALSGTQALMDGEDEAAIRTAVISMMSLNGYSDDSYDEDDLEIKIGKWNTDTRQFDEASPDDANAIHVAMALPQTAAFGQLMNRSRYSVRAEAVATGGSTEPQDVMMVIDCSGSMSSRNPMTYTKQAATVLVNELQKEDRIGLTVYSKKEGRIKTGYLERPMNLDHQPVKSRIPALRPALYTGRTNIGGGMRVGIQELVNTVRRSPNGKKIPQVLMVLTDGRANLTEPPARSPFDSIDHYAQVGKNAGITIHSITLGNSASKDAMRRAAEMTDGEYHHIEDGNFAALNEIFRRIGRGSRKPTLVH